MGQVAAKLSVRVPGDLAAEARRRVGARGLLAPPEVVPHALRLSRHPRRRQLAVRVDTPWRLVARSRWFA
jgi:hypothetical protein